MNIGAADIILREIWSWFTTQDAAKELQNLWYILSIVGFAIAVLLHNRKTRQEKRTAMDAKYGLIQERWIRFLELRLQYPRLEFGPTRVIGEAPLSKLEEYQQYLLFAISLSIFEEVWLLRKLIPPSQWAGWDEYITDYCDSPIFRKLWLYGTQGTGLEKAPNQYDTRFARFIRGKFK